MPDYRTKRQKLQAMANQTASPMEAEIARRKLGKERPATPLTDTFAAAARKGTGRKTSPKYGWTIWVNGEPVDSSNIRFVDDLKPSNHFSDDS